MLTLEPPPGFQGLREDVPVTTHRRHLPHWRQDGATYFVTFRPNDALPLAQRQHLRDLKAFWKRDHPPPHSREQLEDLHRKLGLKTQQWIHTGLGSCLLRTPAHRQILARALRFFDLGNGDALAPERERMQPRYELGAFVPRLRSAR